MINKIRFYFLTFFLMFFCLVFICRVSAQQSVIDSLEKELLKTAIDTSKVNILNQLALKLARSEQAKAKAYAQQAISISYSVHYLKGEGLAYKHLGIVYTNQKNLDSAVISFTHSIEIYNKSGDVLNSAKVKSNLGIIYRMQGDLTKSLNTYLETISVFEKFNDLDAVANVCNNIAIIYRNLGDFLQATDYLYKALKIYEKNNNDAGFIRISNELSNISRTQKEIQKAKEYCFNAIKRAERINDNVSRIDLLTTLASIYYNEFQYDSAMMFCRIALNSAKTHKLVSQEGLATYNIGDVFNKMLFPDSALTYFNKCLEIFSDGNSMNELGLTYSAMGEAYFLKKNYTKSIENLNLALKIGKETGIITLIRDAAEVLHVVYSNVGDYKAAYSSHLLYKQMYDSIFRENNIKELTQKQLQYDFEKKQLAKEIQHKEEMHNQQKITYFAIFGLSVMLLLAIFIYRGYRMKHKSNIALAEKNQVILQQMEEITAQRDEIDAQKTEIEFQAKEIEKQRDIALKQRDEITLAKKEIDDSIQYAKRIQTAIMPDRKMLMGLVPDYFILFEPRDVVSGDFYWMTKKDDCLVIAAADCTGHGVPGAFMSMLGITFLNEIVNNDDNIQPNLILESLRQNIIKSLHQTGKLNEAKDGMDISLCSINYNTLQLQYAGAYNSLIIIQPADTGNNFDDKLIEKTHSNDKFIMVELKPDKMPIGIHLVKSDKLFSNQIMQLSKKDTIYMFSDGYSSQFGGSDGRKFRMGPFKNLLMSIQDKNMFEQKQILTDTFRTYQGSLAQIDDVLVIGIRV